jgi:hypothetical protein
MTDLRYLKNHQENERSGWLDVLVAVVAILAVFSVFAMSWLVLPGAKTVDDVLGIDPPGHVYHPSTHEWTLVNRGQK